MRSGSGMRLPRIAGWTPGFVSALKRALMRPKAAEVASKLSCDSSSVQELKQAELALVKHSQAAAWGSC